MPIVKLTQDFVNNNLICSKVQKRIEFCDFYLPGHLVIVTATSSGGTFFLRYKNSAGKTSYIKIARTNEMSLADARKKAKLLKLEISNGADPSNEKRVQKAVPTLDVFYEDHYKPYAAVHKRSASSDHQIFTCRLERFKHLRLNQITKTMIISLHNELRESGLSGSTSDHAVKFLRHAFNLAIDWNLLKAGENPAAGVKLFNLDNKVEHYLDATELETLMTVLKTGANRPVCMIAMFLLSTGARMNEVLSAKFTQINIDTRTWKIPALNSKSKKVRSVPLNDSALAIISQLDTETEYLFLNRVTGKPYTNIHKAWGKIRNQAGLPHLRIHDLRHQYASFLVNSGRTLYEVQQILGHSTSKVTERYSHLSSATLQAAANSASVMINAAMGGTAT